LLIVSLASLPAADLGCASSRWSGGPDLPAQFGILAAAQY